MHILGLWDEVASVLVGRLLEALHLLIHRLPQGLRGARLSYTLPGGAPHDLAAEPGCRVSDDAEGLAMPELVAERKRYVHAGRGVPHRALGPVLHGAAPRGAEERSLVSTVRHTFAVELLVVRPPRRSIQRAIEPRGFNGGACVLWDVQEIQAER